LQVADHRYVADGAAELVVTNAEQLVQYVDEGMAVHEVINQRCNSDLSNGFLLLDVKLHQTNGIADQSTVSTLRFIKLASSKGSAANIPAFRALRDVVHGRVMNAPEYELPFKASKLTQLCKQSLSGTAANAFCIFIYCVDGQSPISAEDLEDTELVAKMSSLESSAKVNIHSITKTVNDIRDSIRDMRKSLNLESPTTYLHDVNPADLDSLQQLIKELDRVKTQTWKSKMDISNSFLRQRVERFKSEGLIDILLRTKAQVPNELVVQANTHLKSLVGLHNELMCVPAIEHQDSKVMLKGLTLKEQVACLKKFVDENKTDNDSKQQWKRLSDKLDQVLSDHKRVMNDYSSAQKQIVLAEVSTKKT
jgi:hypothetical protein